MSVLYRKTERAAGHAAGALLLLCARAVVTLSPADIIRIESLYDAERIVGEKLNTAV